MKKSFFNLIVVLIHLIYWAPNLFQVYYLHHTGGGPDFERYYDVSALGTATSMVTFYVAYFWLFKRFLYQFKIPQFVIYSLITCVAASTIGYLAITFHQKLPHSYLSLFLVTVVYRSLYAGGVACMLKGFITWVTEIRYKERLEKKNLETSFALLKAQTNPHFLFNTLNNIDVLIEKEPTTASVYLKKLSDILRFTLYETPSEQIALTEELKYITQYIELQRIRTSNPDFVKFEIQGNAEGISIAPMLFIPFIENAFKHCTNKKLNNAIQISIAVQRQTVIFSCSNVYEEQSMHPQQKSGLGLQLIQTRLGMLYPNRYRLDVNKTNQRFEVNLSIDLKHDH